MQKQPDIDLMLAYLNNMRDMLMEVKAQQPPKRKKKGGLSDEERAKVIAHHAKRFVKNK